MTPVFPGNRIRLLVFDLDGTLIDSRKDLATAVNVTLTHFARPGLDISVIGRFIGDGASMLVDRALQAPGWTSAALLEDAMPVFLRSYKRHMLDHTHVHGGVLEALQTIRLRAPELPMAY